MADTGSPHAGQDGAGEGTPEGPKSEAEFFAQNFIPAEASEATLGWAGAVSKDERGNNNSRALAPSHRSRASSRAMYRARQDWQRTVRGAQRQVAAQVEPSSPSPPYAKGEQEREKFWGKFTMLFFRLLGVE